MSNPPVFSLLEPEEGQVSGEPGALRAFLVRLVESAARHGGLVVGEAEPGRYLLVTPALATDVMKGQIDGALDLVLARLGKRWPQPRVTDFGLRELYAPARDRWLAPEGLESLVQEGHVGVVTIFCHDWLYGIATQVASEHGLRVETPFDEYLRNGRVRVAGMTSFQIDVFANATEMATNFYPIDHLIAKVLVLAELAQNETLASRVTGNTCPACGAFVGASARTCASCGAPAPA